jgi:hydroxymethylpyrimidine pyrophosphatase-like HAD family hydrolase
VLRSISAPPIPKKSSEPAQHGDAFVNEIEFYRSYEWSLNPYVTVREAIEYIHEESDRLGALSINEWQLAEVVTNLFLLSCGVLNCVDEYLRGPALALPSRVAANGAVRGVERLIELGWASKLSLKRLARWREQWLGAIAEFLCLMLPGQAADLGQLAEAARKLAVSAHSLAHPHLRNAHLAVPTPFSRLDLTHDDLLALGERYVQRFPDRNQCLLLIGLRTSGSYFVPLLKAFLETQGYRDVQFVTMAANKGAGQAEKGRLRRFGAEGYSAIIVDDPPYTSGTLLAAIGIVMRVGFAPARVRVLAATHPAKPRWFKWLPPDNVITLEPEEWHKAQLLATEPVSTRLAEYFGSRGFRHIVVDADGGARAMNAYLQTIPSDERGARLKRVFEVRLQTRDGERQIRYVLAKSVGWGWYGYPAFLMGHGLEGHVPPVIGLRDGILYLDWVPQREPGIRHATRSEQVAASASYVAARVRRLKLKPGHTIPQRYNNGVRLLAKALSRAYGPPLAALLMRARMAERLQQLRCPCPTVIDGNMLPSEWLSGPDGPLKVDFEHHGLGKAAVNLVDPAYDLADIILNLALSPDEERDLIQRYIAETGDLAVEKRLFTQKLLCGLWAMNEVQEHLFSSARGGEAQRNYHHRFMNAWNFLTVQTAYHCGALCLPGKRPSWGTPLVVLDVDGVLDRRLFGYPSTTEAGVEALSLLRTHDLSVALNTARSASEVKDYCKAYALAGGVAEHGSYIWDAVHQRDRVLVDKEALRQLRELREHLQLIPGVFLDERHQYSIRAFTYREKPLGLIQTLLSSTRASAIGDGALSHLSTHVLNELFVDLNLDQLAFHHTPIDTAVTAKNVDKGTGLTALRDWVLSADAETIAVGDGEPDLAMFRVATRAYAPANVACSRQARLLGCQIARHADQRGLLEIARMIVHPQGGRCPQCREQSLPLDNEPFLSALRAADGNRTAHLVKAFLQPTSYRLLIRS